ncbi:MAG: enoyl-CoA hydratase-related protein [Thermoplasmata archaeon]
MRDPEKGSLVRMEKRGAIGIVWLDHPPVNVLSGSVLDQLSARLDDLEADLTVRSVVLASAVERTFAAGANILEMSEMGPREAQIHGAKGQAVTRRLERLPLPVIAAVHGGCFGGGCEIVEACDFVFASDDAVFGQTEVNLGIMPGWGGTQRLPLRIPPQEARAWVYTGKKVAAPEALTCGLVFRVVPRDQLLAEALRFATELAGKSPLALAAAKFAMNQAIDPDFDHRLAAELSIWERMFGTLDQREGMRAFLEKRPFVPSDRTMWESQSRGFPWARRIRRRSHHGPRRRRVTPNSKR